jgi:hypothetical protein
MQATCNLNLNGFLELAGSLFETGEPIVYRSDQTIQKFKTASELVRDIEHTIAAGNKGLFYDVYYPDTAGFVGKRTIRFNQTYNGQTSREEMEGWGLIQLQGNVENASVIRCRIAVNTQKRAQAWAGTYLTMRNPQEWNWKAVERHARRIIRRMKKIASAFPG